jgi:hypothetical protein
MIAEQSEFTNVPAEKVVIEEDKPTGSTYTSSCVSGKEDPASNSSSATKMTDLSEKSEKPGPTEDQSTAPLLEVKQQLQAQE